MDILFTDAEMIAFLIRRGYEVIETKTNTPEYLHGSRFVDHERLEWIATKDQESFMIRTAFELELKKKLLKD
ncbi:hypothetical protein ACR79T_10080 [Sphingobacterium spiritivorum]|uniref:hypothetical protein n=1 Tax=Sphingobacterium spiritivorum TaxID=258 RepID=UPI003DA5F3A3